MRLAIELAGRGQGFVEPNPMVGCIIVRDGQVIGQGYHERFGGPHAEVNAIRSVTDAAMLRGATAYVTLEPCCHTGKTPPCSDALIDAGISRVVAAMRDPFPQVDGGGIQRLQEAGIEATVGVLEDDARSLNAPYLMRLGHARPFVIAKWAMSADGKIATATGESQWITNDESRRNVHHLRARVDAIVTGMGTVLADDPMLTARNVDPVARTAARVVMCRQRVPPADSKLIQSIEIAPVLIVAGPQISPSHLSDLRNQGAEVVCCVDDNPAAMIQTLLSTLNDRGATNVMLEGGGRLLASFAEAGRIDEHQIFVAPCTIGGSDAPGPLGGRGITRLADAARLRLHSIETFKDDVKLTYRRCP
tara:strand:+ start:49023 stop:50108 length:1086 start_codon:yes stop_codon:yes gene_type:complete